jgi:HD-like signal output (HDOD) protein
VLLANLSKQYVEAIQQSKETSVPLIQSEHNVFGASHAEIGGYLLGLWGLPGPLVEAVVFHHHPRDCQSQTFTPLTAVHAANVLEHETAPDPLPFLRPELDRQYLSQVGVLDHVPVWRTLPVGGDSSE